MQLIWKCLEIWWKWMEIITQLGNYYLVFPHFFLSWIVDEYVITLMQQNCSRICDADHLVANKINLNWFSAFENCVELYVLYDFCHAQQLMNLLMINLLIGLYSFYSSLRIARLFPLFIHYLYKNVWGLMLHFYSVYDCFYQFGCALKRFWFRMDILPMSMISLQKGHWSFRQTLWVCKEFLIQSKIGVILKWLVINNR